MKKILLLSILLICFIAAKAQFKQLAESASFKEPEEGYAKILQLKNGNTIFLIINIKDGIDVHIYNPAHEETVAMNVKPSYGKLADGKVESIFEIKGDVVIFVSEIESRIPKLYRIILDGKTGGIKNDQIIAELPFGIGNAFEFIDDPAPDFYVRKDPDSDTYALVMFNSFESERSKRIEAVVYGGDNKELRRAFASPNEKYKYLGYVDMVVIGQDNVCILTYGYNTKNSRGKENEFFLANLDKEATTVNFTALNFSKDLIISEAITRYNPVTKLLILVALTQKSAKDKSYTPYLAFVDPFAKKLISAEAIEPSDKVINYNKKEFTGLPQDLFINGDGGFTIIYEEMTVNTYQSGYRSSVTTELGRNAVVNYDKQGKVVNDYLIRKSQFVVYEYLRPFYHSAREETAQALIKGNQFKSFAYFNGKTGGYLLINDTQRNEKYQQDGNLVSVTSVGESDAYFYPLKGTDVVPKRDFFFGDLSKHGHNLALFTISDYNKETNTFATLKLEREGRSKGVKIAWLQPE